MVFLRTLKLGLGTLLGGMVVPKFNPQVVLELMAVA